MSKIFLTGNLGFIGKHLEPALWLSGHTVETDFRFFRFRRWDTIIHLAAKTTIKTEFDGELFDSNIVLSEQIFSNPARIIYASSCSAAHLTNPYAYTKKYCEYLGGRHGDALGLRFHNVYGPGNSKGIVWFLMNQADGARIKIRGPELIRDYVFVEDVVKAIIAYIPSKIKFIGVGDESIPPIYPNVGSVDVGTGIGTTTIDLVNLYMKLSGKNFIIDVEEAGDNEPESMISDNSTFGATSLEDGLKKTIKS